MQWGQPSGVYTFSGQFSAPVPLSATSRYNALADLLLGYPSSYTVQTTPFSPHLSYTAMGYYIQDDWRVTDSLTANVGLRWEYFGRPVERDDRMASFDLAYWPAGISWTEWLPAQPGRSLLQKLRAQGWPSLARRQPNSHSVPELDCKR